MIEAIHDRGDQVIQIIPAILATSEEQYKQDLDKLVRSEALEMGWLHIDFADHVFVPNQTVGVEVIAKFPTEFKKEAHLMVAHPKDWIDQLVNANFKRIIFHIESEDNPLEVIEYIKSKGLEVGLAVSRETTVEKLKPFVGKIDVILIMTIVAGFQGQPFIPQTLDKVRRVKSEGWSTRVGVDGAVSDTDAKEIADAGADFMIVGSYLLKGNVDENLEELWEEING